MNDDPTGSHVGTCDAGNCERNTSAIVWTTSLGWLSMCAGHAVLELANGSKFTRACIIPPLRMEDLN